MRISGLLAFALIATIPAYAFDNPDDLCAAGGYFSGAQDRFLSGLAMHIRVKKGIVNDAKCSALWTHAYDVGAHFSQTGKFQRSEDAEVAKKAAKFAARAYEAIHRNMDIP